MHSIAGMDNIISIDRERFFLPKLLICGLIFVYLIVMRLYVYIMYSQDPFFDFIAANHISKAYQYL